MRDLKGTAEALLEELGEQNRRILETERKVQATRATVNELRGRLADDATGARLVERLHEQIAELESECVAGWHRCLGGWIERLRELNGELERLDNLAALGELSASVAHEIRNPLCGILLSSEVLQTKMDAGDSRHTVLQNLHREAEKMEKVVYNLLHFARSYEPRPTRCELEDVVRDTVDAVRTNLNKKGITVNVRRPEEGCEAVVDPDLMHQVFRNLLLNAVDACPPESELTVELDLSQDGRKAIAAFSDPGEGIEPELLERIFDPFYTSKHNGVGLGLSVTKKIVDAHGGRIDVSSTPGQGTTFTVVLPGEAAQTTEKVAA
ncbi:MAG: ATP-binding protein [Candidatus Brocadiia bacterium]